MSYLITLKKSFRFVTVLLLLAVLGIADIAQGQQTGDHTVTGEAYRISSPDTQADAPFLTVDTAGHPVISWIEGDENPTMAYAVLDEDGKVLREPRIIPPSAGLIPHNEMMPKMLFKPDGEIIAIWPVKNKTPRSRYGGLIYYAQSFDNGKTWSDPIPITEDPDSYDQRYFDVAVLPDGNAAIIWLDNRSETKKNGSTLYYAATNGENGFDDEKVIGRSTCQCCRTDIFVDSLGNIHVSYRNIFDQKYRDMAYLFSGDLGKSFSTPKRISHDNWAINACPHTGPTVAGNKYGLHFYWYTMGGGEGVYYTSTTNNGRHFAKRQLFSPKARHPQATAMTSETIAVTWDEFYKAGGAFNNRIGLLLKKRGASEESKEYLTSPEVDAKYPVIRGLSGNRLLVAWIQESNNRQVYYQVITRED